MIRSQPTRVTMAIDSATARGSSPTRTKCSTPTYSPSTFSRTSTRSTFGNFPTPAMLRVGRTLA